MALTSHLLVDLFLVGLAAVACGALCRRFQIPELVGYLAAGILLGPHTPPFPFVREVEAIRAIAAFAVVFRMFALGLEFDLRRLQGRWRPSLFAGLLEVSVGAAFGLGLALLFGWHPLAGLILGAALGTTSTNILHRALAERDLAATEEGRAASAVSLVEDVVVIALLALLALHVSSPSPAEAVEGLLAVGVLAVVALTAGLLFVPLGLDRLARRWGAELLAMAVVGLVFGATALTAGLGAGPALGAFLAGALVGAARHAPGVAARILPVRDLLTALFFVTAGMLLDPALLLEWGPAALLAALLLTPLKAGAVALGLRLGGTPAATALRAGAFLGQTGTLGLVAAAAAFFPAEEAARLFAFAFVAWFVTVSATHLRLAYGSALLERLLPPTGRPPSRRPPAELPRPAPSGGATAWALAAATGCALAVVVAAELAVRAAAKLPPAGLTASGLAVGLALPLLTFPWALIAREEAATLLRPRLLRLAVHPRRLLREGAERLAPVTGPFAVAAGVVILAAPGVLFAFTTEAAARGPVLLGLAAGLLLLFPLRRVAGRIAVACRGAIERAARPRPLGEERLQAVAGSHPFGVLVEGVRLHPHALVVGLTLREARLREVTGASVVAIVPAGAADPVPSSPSWSLTAGDELLVAGTEAQLAACRRHLTETASRAPRGVIAYETLR